MGNGLCLPLVCEKKERNLGRRSLRSKEKLHQKQEKEIQSPITPLSLSKHPINSTVRLTAHFLPSLRLPSPSQITPPAVLPRILVMGGPGLYMMSATYKREEEQREEGGWAYSVGKKGGFNSWTGKEFSLVFFDQIHEPELEYKTKHLCI